MTLRQDLLSLVNDEISLDPDQVVDGDTDLLLTGLVDSLGVIDIVAWLEDRLGVDIDPVDIVLEHFQTVDRMVTFAERLAGNQPNASQ